MKSKAKVFCCAVLMAMGSSLLPGTIQAEVLEVSAHWSGAFSRTASDIVDDTGDGAGVRAIVSDLSQKGSLGRSSVRVVSETTSLPVGFFTANCPSAPFFVEFDYVAHSSVTRIFSTGDLLYTLMDSGHLCLDPGTGRFTFRVDVFVVGGTGRFAMASGGGFAAGDGQFLLVTEAGSPAFGSLDGDTSLQIHVPDEE